MPATDVRIMASMSFMSTAPRPHSIPSRISPAKGSTLQFVRDRGDDVEVSVQDERRLVAVASRHAGDDVRAARKRLVVLGSSPSASRYAPTYSAASRSPFARPPP